ncbi:MAG: NUDIX domain-containing protein [Candidatus Komeilibacteria bacterium]
MREEKVLLNAVVCYLIKNNKICLALKTAKIGKGCLNGFGGGIEPGEIPVEAAIRELQEETDPDETKGVVAKACDLQKIAINDSHNTKSDGQTFVCRVHFYLVHHWVGEIKDTETMVNADWYDIDSLPFRKMMPGDEDWLPAALSGQKVMAQIKLGPYQKELLEKVRVDIVDAFPEEQVVHS